MLSQAFGREFHQLFQTMTVKGWVGHLLAVGVFGVAVPMRQGLDFLDVMFLMAYACLPCLFAAPLVAESVAGRRTSPPVEGYLAQVLTPCAFACFWNLFILATSLIVVNAAHWYGKLILPPRAILWNVVLLSLCATLFAAAITGWLSLNVATPALAKGNARRLFLLVLMMVLMYARLAPVAWKSGIESRLTPAGVTGIMLPVSVLLAALSAVLLRIGAKRRVDEAAGPIFKLS